MKTKQLTVKVLREAFGMDYPAINALIAGRSDDFVFGTNDLLCRSDYIATKLWQREDIANTLRDFGYEGNDDQVDTVLCACDFDDALGDCTDQDWEIIEQACQKAGYEMK